MVAIRNIIKAQLIVGSSQGSGQGFKGRPPVDSWCAAQAFRGFKGQGPLNVGHFLAGRQHGRIEAIYFSARGAEIQSVLQNNNNNIVCVLACYRLMIFFVSAKEFIISALVSVHI